jgi:hypothetical protein
MNEKSLSFRQKDIDFLQKFISEDEWSGKAIRQLENSREDVLGQAGNFLQDEKVKKEVDELESRIPDRFSPSEVNVRHLNGWQELEYGKGTTAVALSVSWAINLYPDPSRRDLEEIELYSNLDKNLKNAVNDILPLLESIAPKMSSASFKPSEKTLSIYYLPSDWIPEDFPLIMEPLKIYLNLDPDKDFEDSVLHEMTHAYIRENTRSSIPIHSGSSIQEMINPGQNEDYSNEPAAVDEAAAHAVSRVISSTKEYNAREYENKGKGLPRGHVHTAFNIFVDVAKQEEDPYKAIGVIRDLAAKSIDKHFKLWEKILGTAADKIEGFDRPETPLDHLKLLAEEEMADFDSAKYTAIEEAAEAFEKSERYSLNFLIGLGLIPPEKMMKYGEHVGDAGAFFPTSGVETDPSVEKEGKHVEIDIDDLEKGLTDLENIDSGKKDKELGEVVKDLSRILKDYRENREKFRKGEEKAEEEEKSLEKEERKLVAVMSSYKATGPEHISEWENSISDHLHELVEYRLQMLERGQEFTQEIVNVLEDAVEHIEKRHKEDEVTEELEKLERLCEKNLEICSEGLENLEKAENILENAEKRLNKIKEG